MGRLTRETVEQAADMQYVGGFARVSDAQQAIDYDLRRLLAQKQPDVLVDFTTRPKTQEAARVAIESGVAALIGSSEWNDEERADLAALCERTGVGAMLVPNFALGAVLMMRFAEQACEVFPERRNRRDASRRQT